ncbi:hypothetical protein JB92DRAFT_1779310 [Gautieria morchelliformis]|nr:hypothetical protein JB92DRAFT_1779310 [Gautieria morchelliformis]
MATALLPHLITDPRHCREISSLSARLLLWNSCRASFLIDMSQVTRPQTQLSISISTILASLSRRSYRSDSLQAHLSHRIFLIPNVISMNNVFNIIALVLLSLGLLSLSALLLTVNACESISRHPVFVNFLRTWLLWACYMSYVYVLKGSPGLPHLFDILRQKIHSSTCYARLPGRYEYHGVPNSAKRYVVDGHTGFHP